MKLSITAAFMLFASFLILHGCGGGGGGGGAGSPSVKLYLFGTLSSSNNIAKVDTSIAVSGFSDYSAPANSTSGIHPLRRGVLSASGPIKASAISGSYDIGGGKILIQITNGSFANMSSSTMRNNGNGTEIATLTTSRNLVFPSGSVDFGPSVGQFRASDHAADYLTGCRVNYVP